MTLACHSDPAAADRPPAGAAHGFAGSGRKV